MQKNVGLGATSAEKDFRQQQQQQILADVDLRVP
jgi:hypothetical protein